MTTAEPSTQRIVIEYDLPHPPAKVWRTLTEPALLAKWVMPNDMRAEVGHRFQFRTEPSAWWDGIVECEVLEATAPAVLSYTWKSGPANTPLDTVVTWRLTPTPAGTKLVLTHDGFLPTNRFAFQGADKGWRARIEGSLVHVLEAL
jgi:uncharacterized protein YndB with AHSA1/START domain